MKIVAAVVLWKSWNLELQNATLQNFQFYDFENSTLNFHPISTGLYYKYDNHGGI